MDQIIVFFLGFAIGISLALFLAHWALSPGGDENE